jgi:hypothetical protein
MTQNNFTGMGTQFMVHDAFAAETQGAIQDRRREHLATGDIIIVGVRRLLREAIETVQRGGRPPNVLTPEADARYPHLVVVNTVIDDAMDNAAYVKSIIEQQTRKLPV